jgi:phage tail-like protein
MRGSVPGLLTPYPFSAMLPAYLQEDQFAVRWVAGFDDALAPIVGVLDCVDAYVDPTLAPEDFAEWLAGWVGAVQDENWPPARRRRAVAAAVVLHRSRGTVAGLVAQLELATGGTVEVAGGGCVSWSRTPEETSLPTAPAHLYVRITVEDPASCDLTAVESVLAGAKPAHLPHTVEVVGP